MGECVCSSCRNLKGVVDENGAIGQYECEFDFPSDICLDCNEENCELTCSHYTGDDGGECAVSLKCKGCGKELKQVCDNGGEGEAYCFDCYMDKIN